MSPRKAVPDDESDDLISKRELQRMTREGLRRHQGKPEPSPLAQNLRWELWLYRESNRLTQQQLGDLLDMKQSQIARLESGFVEPSWETLMRISDRLGLGFTVEVRSGAMTVSVTRPGSRRA